MRLAPLVLLLAGCAVGPRPQPEGLPSAVRTGPAARVWPAVEKALAAEGFEATLEVADTARSAMNAAGEDWEEDVTTARFRARKGGADCRLAVPEMAAVLRGVRSDLRRAVNALPGCEAVDLTDGEAYRERSLLITYKADKVFGSVHVRLHPALDEAEAFNVLTVTVREQPAPSP